jgi:RNA polymerase sigma-54 factor
MATPHGVFEMKYFFTTGYETEDGETLSNTSVKQTLAETDRSRGSQKASSATSALVEDLDKEVAVKIARRTVAKYREELNILPSHMRRSY